MPPSIDLDWILNLDKILDASIERFPDLHIVKTSLLKLSCWINFKSEFWSKYLKGIDIDPSIAEVENSSFSLTSIKRILLGFALYKILKSSALILLVSLFFAQYFFYFFNAAFDRSWLNFEFRQDSWSFFRTFTRFT